ncbi:hypothetical protein CYY_005552 [Polysphondylium violaceum]|uniref:ELMO domain-containing protein n=1 Tax=Polysphondylium violaceum TaxID=133409 RepID=A0A8J4Q2V5_9MYCE|nr:hypothetical protein CYY_005552 [Polysphondylium violaceum]
MERYKIRRQRKEYLKKEIDKQRQLIQEEDYKLMKDEENHEYHENHIIELNKTLSQLKLELEELRLVGDKFYVLHGEDSILIEIDESSKIIFYLCSQSLELPSISIEKCDGSRIQIINAEQILENPEEKPIYELHTILSTKSIHQLFSVKTNFDVPTTQKPSLFERVRQNTWSLGISPLRRTTSDPTIFGERFSPPKSIYSFMERYNTTPISPRKDNSNNNNNNESNSNNNSNSKEELKIDQQTTTTTINNNNKNKEDEEEQQQQSIQQPGKILLTWNNKETSVYILNSQEESLELLELFGSHIDRSKKITAKQSQNIKYLHQQKLMAYDNTNQEHENHLRQLWSLLYPNEEYQKKSTRWKDFGFQSDDPTRDFRGMGMLGLLNLIHLVKHHKNWVDETLSLNRDYPFAVAGINISNLLFEIFQITDDSLQQPWYSSFWSSPLMAMLCSMSREHENAFEELYYLVFRLMDHVWKEMNATYMMFPLVMKRLKSLLIEISFQNPNSYEEVRAKFELIIISNMIDASSPSSPQK